ncbi:patatin-like phospholipase [Pseudoscourfieldia marina]
MQLHTCGALRQHHLYQGKNKRRVTQCHRRLRSGRQGALSLHALTDSGGGTRGGECPIHSDGQTHPVLDILAKRRRENSCPERRNDPFKVGLAVEGGGMRGCVTAGMLKALSELGFDANCFDAAYGSSAGACNLTYYFSKQMEGVDVYANNLPDSGFISLRRFVARAGGLLDIGVLIDSIMNQDVPLDWDRVISHPTELHVLAADCLSGATRSFCSFSNERHLREALRISASPPGVGAVKPHSSVSETLTDPMVTEPVPIYSALSNGCTHVLVLTSAQTTFDSGFGGLFRNLGDAATQELLMSPTPEIREAWRRRRRGGDGFPSAFHAFGIPDREWLDQLTISPFAWAEALGALAEWGANVGVVDSESPPSRHERYVYSIAPGPHDVGSLCCEPEIIRAGVKEGYDAAMKSLLTVPSTTTLAAL